MTSLSTLPLGQMAWQEQQNPGVRSHCRRVAAWALEIASTLDLSASDKLLLEQLCLLHHVPSALLNSASRSRLLSEVAPRAHIPPAPPDADVIFALLDAHQNENRYKRLFEIFETANMFDEQIEMLPFEGETLDELFQRQPMDANPAVLTALPHLRKVSPEQVSKLVQNLPVFPAVAAQAIKALRNPLADLNELAALAGRDQVLAGELVRVANSSLFSARHSTLTVKDAILRVGSDTAQRVMTAAALRPILCRNGITDLWQHSLEAASSAEHVARLSGQNPEEAFLLGLVHDVGRLLFSQLPVDVQKTKDRLTRYGCESAIVEHVVVGMDHATVSAEILKDWKFPHALVEAVRYHHQPERTQSPLAALLYLTEFWTASDEDIASNVRLEAAERLLKIHVEDLAENAHSTQGALEVLQN